MRCCDQRRCGIVVSFPAFGNPGQSHECLLHSSILFGSQLPLVAPGPCPGLQTLALRFGDFVAVDHVSFRIRRGEIFGFLGSNGCGKTMTMKMLTGLLEASGGRAWLFGHEVDPGDIATRRRVGYMSQAFSLYGELTVRQNLELHARLFQVREKETGSIINLYVTPVSRLAGAVLCRLDPLSVRHHVDGHFHGNSGAQHAAVRHADDADHHAAADAFGRQHAA